jgi:hypothetical protein
VPVPALRCVAAEAVNVLERPTHLETIGIRQRAVPMKLTATEYRPARLLHHRQGIRQVDIRPVLATVVDAMVSIGLHEASATVAAAILMKWGPRRFAPAMEAVLHQRCAAGCET